MIDNWLRMWNPNWKPDWKKINLWVKLRIAAIGIAFVGILVFVTCSALLGFVLGVEPWVAIRDIAFAVVAIVGLRLAWIRSKAAADQAASAMASNRTELLNSALRSLSCDDVPRRVAAVRILVDLARQDFDSYFATTIEALAAMVRDTAADKENNISRARPEAQLAVQQIAHLISRFSGRMDFTSDRSILPSIDFSGAYLPGLRVSGGRLDGINSNGATLKEAAILNVRFDSAGFVGANLTGARLIDQPDLPGPFHNVCFDKAEVTEVSFNWKPSDGVEVDEQRTAVKKRLETDGAAWDPAHPPIILGQPL